MKFKYYLPYQLKIQVITLKAQVLSTLAIALPKYFNECDLNKSRVFNSY